MWIRLFLQRLIATSSSADQSFFVFLSNDFSVRAVPLQRMTLSETRCVYDTEGPGGEGPEKGKSRTGGKGREGPTKGKSRTEEPPKREEEGDTSVYMLEHACHTARIVNSCRRRTCDRATKSISVWYRATRRYLGTMQSYKVSSACFLCRLVHCA